MSDDDDHATIHTHNPMADAWARLLRADEASAPHSATPQGVTLMPHPRDTATEKWCSKCQQVKARTEFYNNRTTHDGLQSQCKKCHLANARPAPKTAAMPTHGAVMDAQETPQYTGSMPALAPVPHTLTGPTVPLETWILNGSERPVSLFLTAMYAIVRVRGADRALYHLLRPTGSPRGEPDDAVDEGWILAMIEMFDQSPAGFVFGR